MLRPVLFAAAAIALIAPARAAEPDLAGNWQLTYSPRAIAEQTFAIIKLEMNDGKATASTLYTSLKNANMAISGIEIKGKTINFKTSYLNWSFEGVLDADGKSATGSFGSDQAPYRARLTRTEKTELAPGESPVIRATLPETVIESQKLLTAANTLRYQAFQEKDADKKKELTEKANIAQKELDEKQPGLLRETVAKRADTLFALDAALDLLRAPVKFKITPEDAKKLVADVEKKANPYGTRYTRVISIQLLEGLAYQKGLESAVMHLGEKLSKELTDKDTPALQAQILSAYKRVLEASSLPDKDATLKTVTANLDKIEGKIDAEYLKTVPPFKPVAFAGRKDTSANQVVVMELFTGAQCPPCVAADVAFDALQKSYKPSELVLIQYHLHIPGPDPLTNVETVARAKYYAANSTPTTLFNGKKLAGGGGPMANAEGKFKQYSGIIDPLLEKTTDVKVSGKAHRDGDKVHIAVEVAGAESDDAKLRLLVVEETIKYVGGNNLRFHHQVVRAMPGGADGVAIKDKTFKHSATVDLVNVRKEITAYLDEYAKDRPFPKPQRPMDMKALRVIVLVQNDKTKEIVQALQIEVDSELAARGGE